MTTSANFNFNSLPNDYIRKTGTSADNYFSEKELFGHLVTECYNHHGVSLTYYVVSFDTSDNNRLLGEDQNRKIVRNFKCMGYFTTQKENLMWTHLGIQGLDQFSIFISKNHFNQTSTYEYTMTSAIYPPHIPMIGDIINSTYNNRYLEVIDRKDSEVAVYLQSKQFVWELIVRPMRDLKYTLSADTSATMGAISGYVNKDTDVFDLSAIANTKENEIHYNPTITEQNPTNNDEFWN